MYWGSRCGGRTAGFAATSSGTVGSPAAPACFEGVLSNSVMMINASMQVIPSAQKTYLKLISAIIPPRAGPNENPRLTASRFIETERVKVCGVLNFDMEAMLAGL